MCIGILSDIDSENAIITSSSEERKTTGRMMAVIGALLLLGLAMYHAWIRKTAVLAGVIVPAAIMILYAAWVLFLTKRDNRRFLIAANELEMQSSEMETPLTEVVCNDSDEFLDNKSGTSVSISASHGPRVHSQGKDKGTKRHGHRSHSRRMKKKHEQFLKTKKILLAQQAEMGNIELSSKPIMHRSYSVA